MSGIKKIVARQILDSRGYPTVEVDLWTDSGAWGRACVPSGASTGTREALELRDGDESVFLGKGVQRAVDNIDQKIAPLLLGREVFQQRELDLAMLDLDGTESKFRLGANAILAVSMAICRAAAHEQNKALWQYLAYDLKIPNSGAGVKLPLPMMNILNGGKHASNNLDVQEFMIVPHLSSSFSRNLRAGVEIFHYLKKILTESGYSTNVGDEGGFAPHLKSHGQALECLSQAVKRAGYILGKEVSLSLDVAASEFFQEGSYIMEGKTFSTQEMIQYYCSLCDEYPIFSIEDGLAENDFEGWSQMMEKLGEDVTLVGDDLFVTNKKILAEGIEKKQANAILIKVNQIGSLSETFETLHLAFKNNFKAVISHRSGETGDTFIADLAVASGASHIKTGSASRSDRTEKYNQLLRIEEALSL